jgi:hypothetical protein
VVIAVTCLYVEVSRFVGHFAKDSSEYTSVTTLKLNVLNRFWELLHSNGRPFLRKGF